MHSTTFPFEEKRSKEGEGDSIFRVTTNYCLRVLRCYDEMK